MNYEQTKGQGQRRGPRAQPQDNNVIVGVAHARGRQAKTSRDNKFIAGQIALRAQMSTSTRGVTKGGRGVPRLDGW